MKTLISSLAVLAAVAGSANAGVITVSGAASTTAGSAAVLGANSAPDFTNFSASGSGVTVTGQVQASNSAVGLTQVMTLVLTNFTFTSTATGPVTLTVNIVQDYTVAGPVVLATGSHQFNGNTTGSRSGSLTSVSTHEATSLPTISQTFSGTQNLNQGQGAETTVGVIGGVYTINTTYTFVINAGSGSASIILPTSGVDNATLTLVPLPSAAYAGMGGLALAGFVATRRRNRNQA